VLKSELVILLQVANRPSMSLQLGHRHLVRLDPSVHDELLKVIFRHARSTVAPAAESEPKSVSGIWCDNQYFVISYII
jgi:hypothetical protein